MTFAWPHLLWLLLVPLGLFAWELTRRRQAMASSVHPKILRAEIAHHEVSIIRKPEQTAGLRLRPWLMLGLTFTIVALARPQWGRIDEPVFDQSREILLAIDLSRSMQSPDVKPSRLARAKLLVQALLEKLKGERVGLVVFSGTAFLQSPLSSDYEILREFLPALNPDFLPEGGTNYRALIDTAIDAFGTSGSADRFLIILSDGEATDDSWRSGIDDLKKKGIRVIGLGVGTASGSMIPDGSGGLVKDGRGAVVLSKLESGTLKELAEATHGTYRDASTWIDLASLINQTVNEGRKGGFIDKNAVRLVERFQWPLALALWCLLVSYYYEFPVQPRARDIALRSPRPPKIPTATQQGASGPVGAALLICAGLFAFAPAPANAAVKKASLPPAPGAAPGASEPASSDPATGPGDPATLGKIVSRLSQQDTLSAPDLSELAHETLNWGNRVKEAGQPVPEGPVRDALSAVDQLESRGDKLADWGQLRKELQSLLETPPKPKPQQQPQKQNQSQNDQQKDQQKNNPSQDKNQSGSPQDQPQQSQQSQAGQKPDEAQKPSSEQKQSSPSPAKAENKPDQPFAFGNMNKPPQPQPPPSETQKVGGAPEKKENKEPVDPALALPLEKLNEVRNQDSPGQLFRLMEADRSTGSRTKPTKDW